MASAAKRRSKGSKASDVKRKRRHSGSDEDGPAFLSSKYAEPPTSKIYNSRFNHSHPAELFRKDLISAMKMPDNEPLGYDDYLLIEDSWKPEWERGVQVPVDPEALPEPAIRVLRKRSKEINFKLPKKLIRFTRDSFFNPEVHVMSYTNTLAERTCRYDMDDVDFHWLRSVNEDREDFGLQPLEESFVEQVIEEFEVQAYVNFQEAIKSEEGLGVEYDEDAICDVCRSPDSQEGNEMVFCDSCNICVHQICYGITKIPEGSWICRTCALGIRPPCVLCPNRGGAMKTTRCGQKWAHVGCAVWIPEVSFFNFVKMEPIIKISQIPASRWALVCTLCKEKTGACILCSEKGCKASFHVTCAFNEGLQMRASVKNSANDDDTLKAFCHKHSKKKFSSFFDSDDEAIAATQNMKGALTSEERANLRKQKIQEKEAEFYNYVSIDEIAEMFQYDRTDIENIYNYWKLKRKSCWNRALLTPKIDTENTCAEENSPIAFLKKMVHHRQDLERARNLCYMVIKREKQEKRWTEIKEKIFLKQLEILKKEGKKLSAEEKEAVLNANFGDIAYDKKYSGMNGPSPNMVSVLTNLVGEDAVKVQINGLVKTPSPKKIDRGKTERTPNPYAKHYLNGLVKRSQRWFPIADKQKKAQSRSNSSSHDEKSNQNFSSLSNSSDHQASKNNLEISEPKIDSHFESNSSISQTENDIFNLIDGEICLNFNENIESVLSSDTKENISTPLINEWKNEDDNPLLSTNTPSETDINELDLYVYPLIELQKDPASLTTESVLISNDNPCSSECTKVEVYSDTENFNHSEGCELNEITGPKKLRDDDLPLQRKSHLSKSKSKDKYASNKKEVQYKNVPDEKSIFFKENLNMPNKVKSEVDDEINETDNCIAKTNISPQKPLCPKSVSYMIKDEYRTENENSNATANSNIKITTKHSSDTKNCKIEVSKAYQGDLETAKVNMVVKNNLQNSESLESKPKFNSSNEKRNYINVNSKEADVKSILGNSCLKVSLERNIELQMEQNNVKLPLPYVVLKSEDIVNCVKGKNIISHKDKINTLKLNDKSIKKESCLNNDKTDNNTAQSDKAPVNTFNSTCENKLDTKLRPVSNKNLSIRTHSPTHVKAAENGAVKCNKLSPRHSSQDKINLPSKSSAAKVKNLSISVPPSLSVNKHPSSPLSKCQEKNVLSSSVHTDDNVSELNNAPVSKDKPAPLPKKDMLRGYKIPKKPRSGKPEENSLDLKRGSSPLSPLPDITSSSLSSYHTKGKSSWRTLEPRSDKVITCKTRTTINGDNQQQSERLVLKLKKDMSDPESQRWQADPNTFNRGGNMPAWTGDFVPGHVPPLLPPPLPIFQRERWEMENRGGFAQIHLNYRSDPYT